MVNSGHSGMRKFIQAQDGTPCNHGTRNICIQGKCEVSMSKKKSAEGIRGDKQKESCGVNDLP